MARPRAGRRAGSPARPCRARAPGPTPSARARPRAAADTRGAGAERGGRRRRSARRGRRPPPPARARPRSDGARWGIPWTPVIGSRQGVPELAPDRLDSPDAAYRDLPPRRRIPPDRGRALGRGLPGVDDPAARRRARAPPRWDRRPGFRRLPRPAHAVARVPRRSARDPRTPAPDPLDRRGDRPRESPKRGAALLLRGRRG